MRFSAALGLIVLVAILVLRRINGYIISIDVYNEPIPSESVPRPPEPNIGISDLSPNELAYESVLDDAHD